MVAGLSPSTESHFHILSDWEFIQEKQGRLTNIVLAIMLYLVREVKREEIAIGTVIWGIKNSLQ